MASEAPNPERKQSTAIGSNEQSSAIHRQFSSAAPGSAQASGSGLFGSNKEAEALLQGQQQRLAQLAAASRSGQQANKPLSASVLHDDRGFGVFNYGGGNAASSASVSNSQQQQQPSLFSSMAAATAASSTQQRLQDQQKISAFEHVLASEQDAAAVSGNNGGEQRLNLSMLQAKHCEVEKLQSRDGGNETSAASSLARNAFPAADTNDWYYTDLQGEMFDWFTRGYFTMDLLVRRSTETAFSKLGDLCGLYRGVPFFPVKPLGTAGPVGPTSAASGAAAASAASPPIGAGALRHHHQQQQQGQQQPSPPLQHLMDNPGLGQAFGGHQQHHGSFEQQHHGSHSATITPKTSLGSLFEAQGPSAAAAATAAASMAKDDSSIISTHLPTSSTSSSSSSAILSMFQRQQSLPPMHQQQQQPTTHPDQYHHQVNQQQQPLPHHSNMELSEKVARHEEMIIAAAAKQKQSQQSQEEFDQRPPSHHSAHSSVHSASLGPQSPPPPQAELWSPKKAPSLPPPPPTQQPNPLHALQASMSATTTATTSSGWTGNLVPGGCEGYDEDEPVQKKAKEANKVECELCDTTISKYGFKKHCQSAQHIEIEKKKKEENRWRELSPLRLEPLERLPQRDFEFGEPPEPIQPRFLWQPPIVLSAGGAEELMPATPASDDVVNQMGNQHQSPLSQQSINSPSSCVTSSPGTRVIEEGEDNEDEEEEAADLQDMNAPQVRQQKQSNSSAQSTAGVSQQQTRLSQRLTAMENSRRSSSASTSSSKVSSPDKMNGRRPLLCGSAARRIVPPHQPATPPRRQAVVGGGQSSSSGKARPHICRWCRKKFTTKHQLTMHEHIHQGVRSYSCKWEGCQYKSIQRGHMIRHIRSRHFSLPVTVKMQASRGIIDNRDPRIFMEVHQDSYNTGLRTMSSPHPASPAATSHSLPSPRMHPNDTRQQSFTPGGVRSEPATPASADAVNCGQLINSPKSSGRQSNTSPGSSANNKKAKSSSLENDLAMMNASPRKTESAQLMPVPSPKQIDYNNFDGHELVIHKQPNAHFQDNELLNPGELGNDLYPNDFMNICSSVNSSGAPPNMSDMNSNHRFPPNSCNYDSNPQFPPPDPSHRYSNNNGFAMDGYGRLSPNSCPPPPFNPNEAMRYPNCDPAKNRINSPADIAFSAANSMDMNEPNSFGSGPGMHQPNMPPMGGKRKHTSNDTDDQIFTHKKNLMHHILKMHREQATILPLQHNLVEKDLETVKEGISETDLENGKLPDDKLCEAIRELLLLLVDEKLLKNFGWPNAPIDSMLEAVIKQCNHEPVKCEDYNYYDRLRENAKRFLTDVNEDGPLKELLNNRTVDEVLSEKEQLTELITTHYIEEARDAHQIGLMRHRQVLAQDSPAAMLTHYSLPSLEAVFLHLCTKAEADRRKQQVIGSSSAAAASAATASPPAIAATIEAASAPSSSNSSRRSSVSSSGSSGVNCHGHQRCHGHHLPSPQVGLLVLSGGAMFMKNVTTIRRNVILMLFQFMLPTIEVILFCTCIGLNLHSIPVAVYDGDQSAFSERILNTLNPNVIKQKMLNSS
ncbi:hypothetical protein TYRP_014140 [Tyrophagus putrescentiae]|nr:hypothetical protein TYRP_014140 [Tyrophagus putrescentiae]